MKTASPLLHQQAAEVSQKQPSNRYQRIKELLVTLPLEPIRRPLGPFLRKYAYSLILAEIGKNVYIQSDVELLNAHKVFIKDDVKILRYSLFNIDGVNSTLHLHQNASIDRGVDIRTVGDNCTIEIGQGSYLGPGLFGRSR
jgi:acetyltransferase-like isoleucine patch superfamily enzyme